MEKDAFFSALLFYSSEFYSKIKPENKEHNNQHDQYFEEELKSWQFDPKIKNSEVAAKKLKFKEMKFFKFVESIFSEYTKLKKGNYIISKCNYTKKETIAWLELSDKTSLNSELVEKYVYPSFFGFKAENLKQVKSLKLLDVHYMLLLQRSIRIRILELNIWSRSFLSENNEFVFLVLKLQPTSIIIRAEMDRMKKQLELGNVDLSSFEPVDTKFREFSSKSKLEYSEFLDLKANLEEKEFQLYLENAKDNPDEIKATGGDKNTIHRIFNKINKLTDFNLTKYIITRIPEYKRTLERCLKRKSKNSKKVNLLDDFVENKLNWVSYMVFISVCQYFMKTSRKLRVYDEFEKYKGLIDRLIYLKALRCTNNALNSKFFISSFFGDKYFVKSIWNTLGIKDSMSAYAIFCSTEELELSWRTFEVNEISQRDVFLQMDKIKLCLSILSHSFEIFDLVEMGIVSDIICLHDRFMLKGIPKSPLLMEVIDINYLFNKQQTAREVSIQNYLEVLKESAETSDFLEQSLIEDLSFNLLKPYSIDVDAIRDYFGEKIAVYFEFQRHYILFKGILGIIGLVIYIVTENQLSSLKYESYKTTVFVYMILLLIWIILFGEVWKRKQILFSMRYGQLELKTGIPKLRPGFTGEYIKNFENNELNVLFFSSGKRAIRMLKTFLLSFIFILCSIATTIALLYWRGTIDTSSGSLISYAAILINAVQIILFNMFYYFWSVKFTNYENHNNNFEYENSLTMKLFLFNFFNTFNSFFIISYVKPYLSSFLGTCINTSTVLIEGIDCFNELGVQLKTLFTLQSLKVFIKIIIPYILTKILKKAHELGSLKREKYKWSKVDTEIEQETTKLDYIAASQIDNTLFDMLDLILELCFISFFSMSFPLVSLIGFFSGIINMQIDKYKLIHFFKRPHPVSTDGIGIWKSILEIIIYLSIIINTSIFAFTMKGLEYSVQTQSTLDTLRTNIRLFIIMLVVFIFFKFIIQSLITDIPSNFKIILARHKEIAKSLSKKQFSNSYTLMKTGVTLNFPNKEIFKNFKDPLFILEKRNN